MNLKIDLLKKSEKFNKVKLHGYNRKNHTNFRSYPPIQLKISMNSPLIMPECVIVVEKYNSRFVFRYFWCFSPFLFFTVSISIFFPFFLLSIYNIIILKKLVVIMDSCRIIQSMVVYIWSKSLFFYLNLLLGEVITV